MVTDDDWLLLGYEILLEKELLIVAFVLLQYVI